ncbi:TetR/AcrR family transcriptional regulator [Serratia ficaria]|uniref:TetR/AcrR family transcriptional regulator n=1 Tax=Serratia ficaria TaxID=61651 RepID=UPI002ED3A498|nr:TetR/AcrR family transcriptional regulator [Serratia ficaria]
MKIDAIRRNADETKKKLLLAARNVLAEEGYIAFSENKICDLAGVTRGALRHHFPAGRYDLIKELTWSFLQQIPASATQDGKARIMELIAFMHQQPEQNPLVLIMEIWLASFADERLAASVKEAFDQRYRIFFNVDSLDELPDDLIPYRFMFWGAILSMHHQGKDNRSLPKVLDFLEKH